MAKKIKIHHLLNESFSRTVADWVNLALHTPKLPHVNFGKYVMHSGRILYFACEGNIFSSKFKGPSPGCEGTLLKVCQVVSEDIFPSSVLLQSPPSPLFLWCLPKRFFTQPALLAKLLRQLSSDFATSTKLATRDTFPQRVQYFGCSKKLTAFQRFSRVLFESWKT